MKGLQRCGKSCRMRWNNYLRPGIKRGMFSVQEEQTIIQLHALLGNRWTAIAAHLPKRTDNDIKNHWSAHLKKRLTKLGIDPVTHKPKSHALSPNQLKDIANLNHMAQWEAARLEAEARLTQQSRLQVNAFQTQLGSSSSAQLDYEANTTTPLPLQPICLEFVTTWQGSWLKAPTYNGSLDSRTTALNFSRKDETMIMKAGADLEIPNGFQYPKERMDIEPLQLQGLGTSGDDGSISMATGNEKFILLPNFTEEGLGDIFFDDSSLLYPSVAGGNSGIVTETCCGDSEENNNYWNNMLIW